MKSKIFIDRGTPFVSLWPETLSDGSEVWNLNFRGGDVVHCLDEKHGDVAFTAIATALKLATGEEPLVL